MRCETRVINLSIIAEKDADCYKTMLSEVPFSTQLSINEEKKDDLLKEDLLQITIADRIIIYDLSPPNP
jgi:hypothetical protein